MSIVKKKCNSLLYMMLFLLMFACKTKETISKKDPERHYKEHQKTLDPIEGLYNVFYDVLENKDEFTFTSESILLGSDSAVWAIRKSGRDTFKIIEVIPHKKSTYFPDFTGYFIHKKQELPIDYIGENILFLHPFTRENTLFLSTILVLIFTK